MAVDDSNTDSKSSKLSPTRSYALKTFDSSKPFMTNSWTEGGYSSVVKDALLFNPAAVGCEEALGREAAAEDAAAAAEAAA